MLWGGFAGCGERPGIVPVELDGGSGDGGADGGGGDSTLPVDAAPPACLEAPLLRVTQEEEIVGSTPRTGGDAFYDFRRDQVLIYGGLRGSGDYSPDIVAVNIGTGNSSLLGWVGDPPVGWTQAGAAYDSVGDRVFIVGGMVYGSFSARVLQLRVVAGDRVESVRLDDLPFPVRGPAAAFDTHRQRLVVFGGYDGTSSGQHHDETLVLAVNGGSSWQVLQGAGGPVAQENARAVYVPTYGVVMLASTDWSGAP